MPGTLMVYLAPPQNEGHAFYRLPQVVDWIRVFYGLYGEH